VVRLTKGTEEPSNVEAVSTDDPDVDMAREDPDTHDTRKEISSDTFHGLSDLSTARDLVLSDVVMQSSEPVAKDTGTETPIAPPGETSASLGRLTGTNPSRVQF